MAWATARAMERGMAVCVVELMPFGAVFRLEQTHAAIIDCQQTHGLHIQVGSSYLILLSIVRSCHCHVFNT